MKSLTIFFFISLIFIINQVRTYSQSGGEFDYFGQTPPGDIPEVFAPGIISINGQRERSIAISPNGDEVFFCRVSFPYNKIYHTVKTDTGWTTPAIAEFSKDIWATESSFSPDGLYLYFSSSKGKSSADDYSLWRVKKNETGWEEPEFLIDLTENNVLEFHPQVSSDGSLYFCYWQGNAGKIYLSKFVDGQYSIPVGLPLPVNTQYSDTDPYVDPEGNYLIMKSTRPGGVGSDDGYISYKKDDGTWTYPKNLGTIVNTTNSDDVGDVSPDGKYLFFTRNNDIYWVKADDLIDSLRHTNFAPYVKSTINEQNIYKNVSFYFPIPDSIVADDDGNETLSYTASSSTGGSLPIWLQFNPSTKTFSGIPTETGIYNIRITATDTAQTSVSTIFKLKVNEVTVDYFAQTLPSDSAIIFASGIISKPGRFEHAAIYSRDGKELYFSETPDDWIFRNTYVRKYLNNSWTEEEVASFSSYHIGGECTISYTNDSLIYTDGYDFWMVKRNDSVWTEPQKLPNVINSFDIQWHPTIASNGNIYFSSRGNLYKAEKNDTIYQTPVMLPSPVNSNNWDADAVIAEDESYIIFNSDRSGGFGSSDLYISYYIDGVWTNPINLGSKINSEKMDDASSISPDGKYFLFSRRTDQECDIYWVSTGFIDSIRQTITNISEQAPGTMHNIYLSQNYPNPFNPITTIRYSLDKPSPVILSIYNLLGQKVKILRDSFQNAGEYSLIWDATDYKNKPVSSGIYFYILQTDELKLQKKMILIR